MKLKELKALVEGIYRSHGPTADELDVVVRAWDDNDNDYVGTIGGVEVQHAHDEDSTPYVAIDCGPDETGDDPEELVGVEKRETDETEA